MCGILGYISGNKIERLISDTFESALGKTSHRGPDETKRVNLERAIIGFNRLSIVGENNGSQPISNEDHTIWMVCNGEIYNHEEIKKDLHEKHNFVTNSDCEVIVHAYEEYADDFVKYLKGQFAGLIYDTRKELLILFRDRFGINPLYYAINSDKEVYVSSEVKAILYLNPIICTSLDPLSIKETLFLYGPTSPRTVFKNVFQVNPGHIMKFEVDSKIRILEDKKYWELPSVIARHPDEITKQFKHLLIQSIRRRVQADNPSKIGTYLSGGVDSSTVTGVLKLLKIPVKSFSVKFDNDKFDESRYQKIVAKYLDIPLHSCTGDNIFERDFENVIWHTELPMVRTAPIPLYSLSRLVRSKKIKYVMCGEGADEMMLGYPVLMKKMCSIKDKLKDNLILENLFVDNQISGKNMVDITCAGYSTINRSVTRQMQLVEIATKLSRYLLVQQGDRLAMSHSIEQRFPFLDEDLVDFLFSIPDDQFEILCMDKKLLRGLAKNILPKEITQRTKQGYLAPMDQELFSSKIFSSWVSDIESQTTLKIVGKYFDIPFTKRIISKFQNLSMKNEELIGLLLIISTVRLHRLFIR